MELSAREIKDLGFQIRSYLRDNPNDIIKYSLSGHLQNQLTAAEIEATFSKDKTAKLRLNSDAMELLLKILHLKS